PQRLLRVGLRALVLDRLRACRPQLDERGGVVRLDVADLDRLAQCHRTWHLRTGGTGRGTAYAPRCVLGTAGPRAESNPNCYQRDPREPRIAAGRWLCSSGSTLACPTGA